MKLPNLRTLPHLVLILCTLLARISALANDPVELKEEGVHFAREIGGVSEKQTIES